MGNKVAVALSVLLVAGAVVAAWLLLGARTETDPRAEARAVVGAYLAAWERSDIDAMADQVRRDDADELPDGFMDLHQSYFATLEPDEIEIERDAITMDDSLATTDIEVTLALPYADELTYDGELELSRIRGDWAVDWEPTVLHPDLQASDLEFAVERRDVERAPILDVTGEPLTGPGEVHVIGVEPRRLGDDEEVLEAFGEVLPGVRDDLEELLERDDLVGEWFYPVITLDDERFDRAWRRLQTEPGVLQRSEQARVSAGEGFALHVLGRTAEATEEQLEELGAPYAEGDQVGQYGLEAELEERLVGSAQIDVVLSDGDDTVAVLHSFQDDVSEPVRTTLDGRVQRAIENTFEGRSEDPAAIVVLDAESGAVRGAASRPLSGENRAFVSAFPPGSTFKLVTATALLDAGTKLDSEVTCPERVTVGGLEIGNAGDLALGTTTFEQAIANSCNTTVGPMAIELGRGPLAAMARRYGFRAVDGGLRQDDGAYGLALEAYAGSFPQPRDATEIAAASFGQGRVEATPLHMASVAAGIASGTWRSPYLLDDERDEQITKDLPNPAVEALRTMMRRVVTDGSAADAGLPGGTFGKTGSAEFDDTGDTHAWFIGYRDGLAFAVFLEQGGAGGEDAAPLAARLLRELDGIDTE